MPEPRPAVADRDGIPGLARADLRGHGGDGIGLIEPDQQPVARPQGEAPVLQLDRPELLLDSKVRGRGRQAIIALAECEVSGARHSQHDRSHDPRGRLDPGDLIEADEAVAAGPESGDDASRDLEGPVPGAHPGVLRTIVHQHDPSVPAFDQVQAGGRTFLGRPAVSPGHCGLHPRCPG